MGGKVNGFWFLVYGLWLAVRFSVVLNDIGHFEMEEP
jgi:hypothetical protein